VRYPVSYTEIKNLEKLTAYLNLPGNWPVTKIKMKIFDRKPIAEGFIPSKIRASKITPINLDDHMIEAINDKISKIEMPTINHA
jgi:hypothetical protein